MGSGRGRSKAAFLLSRELHEGLHPKTLGSCLKLKADAKQQLSSPGAPSLFLIIMFYKVPVKTDTASMEPLFLGKIQS